MPKKFLPLGINDFKKIIEGNYIFVDKSNFIKNIMDDVADVILISRPRRFGKTLNLSMLYYFLQNNFELKDNLFKNLNIANDKKFCSLHQNQYPVIFLSLDDIKKADFNQAYAKIVNLLSKLYKEHRYLLEGNLLYNDEKEVFNKIIRKKADQSEIEDSLISLVDYIKKKFGQPPILIIDEYDTPIQEAYIRGYYQDMLDLMHSLLGQVLKDNTRIKKAIISGITRVAQENLFSGINNFTVYTPFNDGYAAYFGFDEDEVIKLLKLLKHEDTLESVRNWYGGYKIGEVNLYNPWSVLNFLKYNCKHEPYWINTADNHIFEELLTNCDYRVKEKFELLLQNKIIEKPLLENLAFSEIKPKEEAMWSFLVYAGYIAVLSSEIKGFQLISKLYIPNKEIMFFYDGLVAGWFRKRTSLETYKKLIHSFKIGEIDRFKQYISEYLEEKESFFDLNRNSPNSVFYYFMLGLTVGLKDNFLIEISEDANLKRLEIIFIPITKNASNKGILLEFKISDKIGFLSHMAKTALEHISNKSYLEKSFKKHNIEQILAIGLAFCGRQVELAHEEIKLV